MILKEFANVLSGSFGSIAAAGTTQATATAVSSKIQEVTAASGTNGVVLPAGDDEPGTSYLVYSSAATNALLVFPPSGDAINAGAVDASYSVAARTPCLFIRVSASQWLAVKSA